MLEQNNENNRTSYKLHLFAKYVYG